MDRDYAEIIAAQTADLQAMRADLAAIRATLTKLNASGPERTGRAVGGAISEGDLPSKEQP